MIKKLTLMGILFFIASTFLFCIDEEQKNPQPDLSDARARIRPKADAGNDVTITLPTNASKLDGSNSKDSLGVIKSYQWSKISGPPSLAFSNPSNAVTDVINLINGTYTFRLTVTNDKNAKAYDDVVVTVNENKILAGTTLSSTEELYFIGNMDNVTISGTNSLTFNGWSDLKSNSSIDGLWLNNLGNPTYAFQEVRKDPLNSVQNVLYAQTNDDDPNQSGTSRAQMTIGFKDGVNLPVYHTSHRMYLSPDIGYLTNYSSAITWFTLFEIWNQRVSSWDGDEAGSARWSLSAKKASGTGQQLYWEISAQYMQPANIIFKDFWRHTNKTIPIPLGKWFTLDMYMKRGEGTSGKMVISITPDGGASSVIFDITNSTIYPGRPDIQLDSFQPFKLYLDDAYLDWMRANGKKISAYYNDFKWYKN